MASSALDALRSADNLANVWKDYWKEQKHKRSAPGVDGFTPRQFNDDLKRNLRLLRADLYEGYIYSSLRGIPVPKKDPAKKRLICIPTVRDRLVQRALLRVIESKASQLGIANDVSYGFIPASAGSKRGAHAARAVAVSQRQRQPWAFKADIEAFFDSIPRDELIQDFETAFRLRSLTPLVKGAINCEVDNSNPVVRRVLEENRIKPRRGLRQGMPLSPILSNFVLREFDKTFAKHGYNLVRYADDLIVLAGSHAECEQIMDMTITELSKLKLNINPSKTVICSPEEPVEFLGMELGLKAGTSTYCLRVSELQMEEIRKAFTCYHDWEFAYKKGLDVAKLFRRLDNMRGGYKVAYGVADNFKELDQRLDRWAENCAKKIYTSIFGPHVLENLTSRQKAFLMMPHSN
jgi:RNA-directed DNA polymerase